MSLTAAQWGALRSLCDALLPGSPPDLPDRMVEALSTSGNPRDLKQFGQALSLLESPFAGLLLSGQPARFSRLDRPGREAVLLRWATHPLPVLRQAFQGFKRLAAFLAYAAPGNPAWPEWGYPGTDSHPPGEPLLQVAPLAPHEEWLAADAVVVGSGAGGGVAAAELAGRGLQVIVLEKGGYYPEPELGGGELWGMQRLYLDRGMTATRDLSVPILAGSAVGGGTLINWTACVTPPDWLREEWEREYGLAGMSGPEFQSCLDRVLARLQVSTEMSTPEPHSSAGRLIAGCQALGYQVAELPRNVTHCGHDCGFCTFGCRTGSKQSTARTFLVDAAAHGARIIPGADVRRVLIQGGRVAGVEALVQGRPVTIRAPRVVMAAGAIGSPAILLRSGLEHPALGRHLHLHPVAAVVGRYPEPVNPWAGRLLPAYSRQFARIDGNYGFLLEVAPAHPGLAALNLPWAGGEQYRADTARMPFAGNFIALVRDRGSGRVTVDREGRHQIDYRLSPYDRKHLLMGQAEMIKVHGAAGATEIFTLHAQLNRWVAGGEPVEAFAARSMTLPSGPNQLPVLCAHQMGTCRMGRSPREAVANPEGEVYGVRGLHIADTSAFPAASGVNPMITAMSLGLWNARRIV
ncbi:MAG: GMC family oxidoreductase N-terminal domain-containing protein [Bacillota bacterium]